MSDFVVSNVLTDGLAPLAFAVMNTFWSTGIRMVKYITIVDRVSVIIKRNSHARKNHNVLEY